MSFILYDILFLVAFAIFVSVFLYTRKKNLKKEGWLFLYKANWGIKLINYVGKKYTRTLKVMSWISVSIGYVLMGVMLYLLGKIVYIYVAFPSVVKAIKVPPILPLFPYLPSAFKLDFLPPFYFTYWILILAVVAITHEFSHGIFAAHNKVKIKTTGFGFFPFFLPIFLAAFVELDEKVMAKKSKFAQLSILSGGTFANIITAIIGFFLLWGFFVLAFSPTGVVFDSYAYSSVNLSQITGVNGIPLNNLTYNSLKNSLNEKGFSLVSTNNGEYLTSKNFLELQNKESNKIFLYHNAPALRNGVTGAITKINGVSIVSLESLGSEISKYSPGEKIVLELSDKEGVISTREVTLDVSPVNPKKPWLGISFYDRTKSGIGAKLISIAGSFKKQNVFYTPKLGEFSWFIYNLLWWLVLISISIALVNMLPVGIFDGGRFFYLTIWKLTKSEKIAARAFKFTTWFILFLILLMMIFWVISF